MLCSDDAGEVIFSLVVVISVAGSLAAVLMAAPRVYFAMARDGIFFASFGAVDPRRDVPARATAVQATLAAFLALTGSFEQILSYFMVPTLAFPGTRGRRDLRPAPSPSGTSDRWHRRATRSLPCSSWFRS